MSIDLKMAWRNVWRNPRRTVLTMAAVAFSCLLLVFMLSWQWGSYQAMINSAVGLRTGHLQVQAPGYQKNHDLRKVLAKPGEIARLLEGLPQVAAYSPRANAFALVSSQDRTYGVMISGVDPAGEARVSRLPGLVRQGRFLRPGDGAQAVLGRLLAQNLRVKVGDEVVLLGQGRDGSVAASAARVAGIVDAGQDELDRSLMQLPLAFFQETFAMRGAVHEMVILTHNLVQVPSLRREIQKGLAFSKARPIPVVPSWRELMPGLLEAIQLDLMMGLVFYFILIVVVAFSILNTFLMAVLERTREFGVLRSLGVTPLRLFWLVLLESGFLTGLGMVAGTLMGVAVTWYFQVHGIHIGGLEEMMRQYGISDVIYPQLTQLTVAAGPVAVMLITFFSALLPAIKVTRLKPVEALSHG